MVACLLIVAVCESNTFSRLPTAFVTASHRPHIILRGGATKADDDEDEYEYEDEDDFEVVDEEDEDEEEDDEEEEEEEEEMHDAALAAAALSSAQKTQRKLKTAQRKAVKQEVASKLAPSKKKKKSRGVAKQFLPYIIRASLNPFTVWSMARVYFASLINVDYMKDRTPSDQELRSALEEKAKRSSPGPKKGKRKMKRGQAKTLSDLPQLSA